MLIENIAYSARRLQIQSAINAKISTNNLHELKSLNFLLFEEFDSSEAGELEKNLMEVLKVITKLGQQSNSADFKKLIADPISGVLSAERVPDASDEKAVNTFVTNVRNGADEIAKIISAIERVKAVIGPPPAEGADQPIVDKLENDKEAADKIIKAVKAAYVTPEWFTKAWGAGAKEAEAEAEGFFGKIKGFFSGLFKAKSKAALKPDNVAKGILSMTFVDLDNINIEAAKKALIGETKEVASDTTDLTGSAIADDSAGGGAGAKDLEALAAKYKSLIQDMAKEDPEAAKEELQEPAEELGLTTDELQGAIEDPETLDDLADEKEIDPADVKAAIEDAAEEADPDTPLPNDEIEALDPADEIEAAEEEGLTGPKAAVAAMMKNWADSLSATSKKSLAMKNRGASLQQGIFDAIDATIPEIESLVAAAVAGWRSEHEETLVKSKRFAKKNFVSLEELIPKMVSTIVSRTNESPSKVTSQFITKFVRRCLDVHYGRFNNAYFLRLNELAGISGPIPLLEKSNEQIKIKNSYKRSDFEGRLEDAFIKAFPDFKGDVATLMAMAMGDYIKNEVEEIVLERRVLSLLLYEKYDFKAISAYMKDQMGDLPDDAGITGKEDAVIADFLRSIEPILGEEGVELSGIPSDSTDNQEEEPGSLTDEQGESLEALLARIAQDVTDALEADEEGALEKLADPAAAIGIDADELALGIEDSQDLKDLIVDQELDADEVITQLGNVGNTFGADDAAPADDDQRAEVEAAVDDFQAAFDEESAEDKEAALEKLEEPAAEIGVSPEEFVDIIEDPFDFAEEEQIDVEELLGAVDQAEEALEPQEEEEGAVTDEQESEIEASLEDLFPSFEEAAAEDEDAAIAMLQDPASEIGVSPEELADAIDDPQDIEDLITDKELDTDEVISQLDLADELFGKEEEQAADDADKDVPKDADEPEQTEEELEVEADPAEEIEAAAAAGLSAKDAVAKALTDWGQSLSKTSQSSLETKKRGISLRDAIFGAIDTAGEKMETAVRTAVANWRAEHEETLIRSKRFAKKNFASLEDLVPQLAVAILTKANESHTKKLTYVMVEKAVYNYLNRKFSNDKLLQEFHRMNRLAGLDIWR